MRETLLAMKPSIMRRHLVSANGHEEENVGEGEEREREEERGFGGTCLVKGNTGHRV